MFAPDSAPYDGRPVYENIAAYQPPTWLMTGVWMSESSGFAVAAPRADSDTVAVHRVAPPQPDTGTYERTAAGDSAAEANPERERMIARESATDVPPSDDVDSPDKPAKPPEPRIEQYRER